jgi:hypothetical protein
MDTMWYEDVYNRYTPISECDDAGDWIMIDLSPSNDNNYDTQTQIDPTNQLKSFERSDESEYKTINFTQHFPQLATSSFDTLGNLKPHIPIISQFDIFIQSTPGYIRSAKDCYDMLIEEDEVKFRPLMEDSGGNIFGNVERVYGEHEYMVERFSNYMIPASMIETKMLNEDNTGYLINAQLGIDTPEGLEEYIEAYEMNNQWRLVRRLNCYVLKADIDIL